MTKNYNSPMLQIVSIKNSDILTNSPMGVKGNYNSGEGIVLGASDRIRDFNEWYEGY